MKRISLIDLTFIITIAILVLGFVNIYFVYIGLLCYTLPFIIYLVRRKNVWCTKICPRSSFLSIVGKIPIDFKRPKWFKHLKKIILVYFFINITIMIMTTVNVYAGNIEPIARVRFFMVFPLINDLPQYSDFYINDWSMHLAYRIYSSFLSTTIAGVILAILYKPRTWCSICPVMTILNSGKKKNKKRIIKAES